MTIEWFGSELNYAVCMIHYADGKIYYGIVEESEDQTLQGYDEHPNPENLIRRQGQGVLFLKDGTKKEGIWEHNSFIKSLKISDYRINLLIQKYPPPKMSDKSNKQPKVII